MTMDKDFRYMRFAKKLRARLPYKLGEQHTETQLLNISSDFEQYAAKIADFYKESLSQKSDDLDWWNLQGLIRWKTLKK